MTTANYDHCLAETLKWEGGYSNHPDDPGGPTMRGVIQREYDLYRKGKGLRARPVRQIEESELQDIYRNSYWIASRCDDLADGLDLCVFDAAVNSGPSRADAWLNSVSSQYKDLRFGPEWIDAYCDHRLAFLKQTGRLWRVFGPGWSRRVAGIRHEAKIMAGHPSTAPAPLHPDELHAGMTGERVRFLQSRLRALGYPAGEIDGIFGQQTWRAVQLFQQDHLEEMPSPVPGVWGPEFWALLDKAGPMLPKRQATTTKDLQERGDPHIQKMGLFMRLFGWLFGGASIAQLANADGFFALFGQARGMFEPVQEFISLALTNKPLFLMALAGAGLGLVLWARARYTKGYQNFDHQGTFVKVEETNGLSA